MRKFNRSLSLLAICTSLLFTTGCSQRVSALNDTLKLAFIGDDDVKLSTEQVSAIPYASIYAKIDDFPQVFIALAFAEAPDSLVKVQQSSSNSKPITELKWLSADSGMLVTVNGRLIKTHNLYTGNLSAVNSEQTDPVQLGLHLDSTPKSWTRQIDWQPNYHYGYTATSQFQLIGEENILINDTPTNALHFSESVYIKSLNVHYQNEFWLKPDNGLVIKSRQKIAPNLPFIEITLLKSYAA